MPVYDPLTYQKLPVSAEEVNVTLPPAQKVVAPLAVITGVLEAPITVRSLPLSKLAIAGLVLTTRIRYPVAPSAATGMVTFIDPEVVLSTVPIFTGEIKRPVASLNWAVNLLPVV